MIHFGGRAAQRTLKHAASLLSHELGAVRLERRALRCTHAAARDVDVGGGAQRADGRAYSPHAKAQCTHPHLAMSSTSTRLTTAQIPPYICMTR